MTAEKIEEGYLEQLYTFSHPVEHDTRVDIIYFYLLPSDQIKENNKQSYKNTSPKDLRCNMNIAQLEKILSKLNSLFLESVK